MNQNSIINSIIKNYDNAIESKYPELEVSTLPPVEDKLLDKKLADGNYSIDYKVYKNNRIKTLLSKNKIKKQQDETEKEMNILTLNLVTDPTTNNMNDIDKLSFEEKYNLINRYIRKKNIILSEQQMNKINELLIDSDIILKKYISVSAVFGDITKISFIVKNRETGEYNIDINNLKSIKKENKKRFLK